MEFNEEHTGDIAVVTPIGRVDAATADELQKKLLSVIGNQPVRLVLDCSQIKYISSIGLRVLIVAAKKAAAMNGRFVLCAAPRTVAQIFDLAGLVAAIPIHGTRAEALAAIQC